MICDTHLDSQHANHYLYFLFQLLRVLNSMLHIEFYDLFWGPFTNPQKDKITPKKNYNNNNNNNNSSDFFFFKSPPKIIVNIMLEMFPPQLWHTLPLPLSLFLLISPFYLTSFTPINHWYLSSSFFFLSLSFLPFSPFPSLPFHLRVCDYSALVSEWGWKCNDLFLMWMK